MKSNINGRKKTNTNTVDPRTQVNITSTIKINSEQTHPFTTKETNWNRNKRKKHVPVFSL
jgi:hypothetical protein